MTYDLDLWSSYCPKSDRHINQTDCSSFVNLLTAVKCPDTAKLFRFSRRVVMLKTSLERFQHFSEISPYRLFGNMTYCNLHCNQLGQLNRRIVRQCTKNTIRWNKSVTKILNKEQAPEYLKSSEDWAHNIKSARRKPELMSSIQKQQVLPKIIWEERIATLTVDSPNSPQNCPFPSMISTPI